VRAIKMKNNAFSITELMIVIILIGVMAGFALPSFTKAVLKAQVRDAMIQLEALYAANRIFRAQNNTFWTVTVAAGPTGAATINGGPLGLNLVSNGLSYGYTPNSAVTATLFTATAARTGTNAFTVRINQNLINPLGGPGASNPCCVAGGYCTNFPQLLNTC
jgi:prepilin-type N-terminal cleavage/methylation domain-containing protein